VQYGYRSWGKNGVIAPDQVTFDYVNARNAGQKALHAAGQRRRRSLCFEKVYDVTKMEPVVAKPHVRTTGQGSRRSREKARPGLHRSCTGGKMTDFRAGRPDPQGQIGHDRYLRGPRHQRESPAGLKKKCSTAKRWKDVFLSAGSKTGEPSCAACLEGRATPWPLNAPISCISTTNRKLPAAWATSKPASSSQPADRGRQRITGTITDPRDCLNDRGVNLLCLPTIPVFKIVARNAGKELARLAGSDFLIAWSTATRNSPP